ncbi:hypothetical protein MB27_18120 [Actinoplanes utahensis]|uniref:Uncharacterized protein n=2 Tax=Actinoplanes utahensis TaxID=1869 RepID=A0A0A6ULP0_ACTUT|nr:hypothetical protein MB27_18120 [Actinoplanes utahensis]
MGWGVERHERTASRSVITHGGSPLMPSHSQGAERRTERRARRTGSRWALRALVIGGLAGAAWLLTGSAAQAAGSDDLVGAVLDDVATVTGYEPAVGEILEAVAQPPETPAPENHRPEWPVDTPEQDVHDDVARHAATGSPRASGGTTDDRALPATAEPVSELPKAPAAVRMPAQPAERTAANHSTRAARAGGVTPSRPAKAYVHRLIPAARPAPETTRTDVPAYRGVTPVRMTLGATSQETGSVAVLPARVANGAVEERPLPFAAEAFRHDAEAPTVSPDQ